MVFPLLLIIVIVVVVGGAAGGYYLYTSGYLDQLMQAKPSEIEQGGNESQAGPTVIQTTTPTAYP